MKRHRIAMTAAAMLAAVLSARLAAQDYQRGSPDRITPPGNGDVACTATYDDMGLTNVIPTWVSNGVPTDGFTQWWKYEFDWWYSFKCNGKAGDSSECGMQVENEIDYMIPSGQWVLNPLGYLYVQDVSAKCAVTVDVYHTTYWSYPESAGTPMRIIWNIDLGAGYTEVDSFYWTIPPNPKGK